MSIASDKAQFTKIKNKYANCRLEFNHYFKYDFQYIGVTEDGKPITVSNYGTSNWIYRAELFRSMTLKELCNELPIDYIEIDGKGYGKDYVY